MKEDFMGIEELKKKMEELQKLIVSKFGGADAVRGAIGGFSMKTLPEKSKDIEQIHARITDLAITVMTSEVIQYELRERIDALEEKVEELQAEKEKRIYFNKKGEAYIHEGA